MGSATSCGVLHDGDEAVGEIDLRDRRWRLWPRPRVPPSSNAPAAPPQATSTMRSSFADVREGIEIAKVVGVLRREDRASDDDAVAEQGRDRVEAFAAVERQAEAVQILIAASSVLSAPAELEALSSRSH